MPIFEDCTAHSHSSVQLIRDEFLPIIICTFWCRGVMCRSSGCCPYMYCSSGCRPSTYRPPLCCTQAGHQEKCKCTFAGGQGVLAPEMRAGEKCKCTFSRRRCEPGESVNVHSLIQAGCLRRCEKCLLQFKGFALNFQSNLAWESG